MESRNNLSSLLEQLMMVNNNAVESFARVNEAVTSEADTVTLSVEDKDGNISQYTIPSFGYLRQCIERLNNNIEALCNVDANGSAVRLSDGTYRKLMTMRLPSEAPTITSLNTVNEFTVRSNYFFENMLNPLLCVDIDLTGKVGIDTERVMVKRFLLKTDTEAKATYFDNNFKGNSGIDYNNFLNALVDEGIMYVLDEEIVDIPPRSRRYTGKFDVLGITNKSVTEIVNGEEVVSSRRLVRLNKLTYTDNKATYTDTQQLAVGDMLEVVSDPVDTRYKITHIDTSTNTVVLQLVEGFRTIRIGADYFRVYSEKDNEIKVQATVGFGEKCVIFIKPVDPDSNIPSNDWSGGVGFDSNSLTMLNEVGKTVTLQQYYQKYVADFGAMMLGYANDWYPTSTEGVKPDAPVLNQDDFSVEQINKQVTELDSVKRVKTLNDEKHNLSDQIAEKRSAINSLKSKIQTSNYASDTLRQNDKLLLESKVAEYQNLVNTYSSTVKEIASIANSDSLLSVKPKYRVRGFWEMPKEKSSDATGQQAIIRFKIRYRYLNPYGNTNATKELGEQARGTFSNWNMTESILRGRSKNSDGVWTWDKINNNDSEAVNINQLDIPITKGEKVEVQVASVSEAGYPSNPLVSDWSESMIISFPDELSTNSVVDDILHSNTADESQLQIDQTLVTRGVISHIADSFYANEQNFVHTTQSIASGFLSAEQTPVSLFEKLTEMQTQIGQLLDIVGNAMGEMVVTITDESGNVYNVDENNLLKIYAGSYSDEVSKLSVKKGAIITKNFMLNIHNVAETGLRLQSKCFGSRTVMVDESANWDGDQREYMPNRKISDGSTTYNPLDSDYNTYYRYDLVPLNLYSNEGIVPGVSGGSNYQSAQCKNQFLNLRYRNISDNLSLYGETEENLTETLFNSHESQFTQMPFTAVSSTIFGGYSNGEELFVNEDTFSSNPTFAVHKDHPYTKSSNELVAKLGERLGVDDSYQVDPSSMGNLYKYLFTLSKNIEIPVTNIKSIPVQSVVSGDSNRISSVKTVDMKINQQVPYEYILTSIPASYFIDGNNEHPSEPLVLARTHKMGYEDEDRYLLGTETCTSYLFLNTGVRDDVQVDGDARNSSKVVTGGAVISIPFTFQYRMTDYWGEGETGTGRIMGDPTISNANRLNISNIRLANRLGIDIWLGKDKPFSFDIEVYANYGETSSNINPSSLVQFNSATMTTAINKSDAKKNSKASLGTIEELNVIKPQQTKTKK